MAAETAWQDAKLVGELPAADLAALEQVYHGHLRAADGALSKSRGLQYVSMLELRKMGADKVRVTHRGEKTYWLQAGTCRFGKDPQSSVLDPGCRVHGANNVLVTDGSGKLRPQSAASFFESVSNPLPARGGTDPEPMEEARQNAPAAFRVQQRAVTPDDYAEKAGLHPDVQRAAATWRWTGCWYTIFLTIDRRGGRGNRKNPCRSCGRADPI